MAHGYWIFLGARCVSLSQIIHTTTWRADSVNTPFHRWGTGERSKYTVPAERAAEPLLQASPQHGSWAQLLAIRRLSWSQGRKCVAQEGRRWEGATGKRAGRWRDPGAWGGYTLRRALKPLHWRFATFFSVTESIYQTRSYSKPKTSTW